MRAFVVVHLRPMGEPVGDPTSRGAEVQDAGTAGWSSPSQSERYNGQVLCGDGRDAWVIPRCHPQSGWAVEIRDQSKEGVVLDRLWCPHHQAARLAVNDLRSRLAVLGHQVGDSRLTGGLPPSALWRRRVLYSSSQGASALVRWALVVKTWR